MRIRKTDKTVPRPFLEAFQGVEAPRKVIRAGDAAVKAWNRRVADAEAIAIQQQRERDTEVRTQVQRGLAETVRDAMVKGEEVSQAQGGPVIIARDGLMWLLRKATISAIHYDAGLRFRGDYELANGTGVASCLRDPGAPRAMRPKAGTTDAMMNARGNVKDALLALGSPLLRPYVQLVAGEGAMLNDERFGKDARAHELPVRIALDLLARHYGMIK